MCFSFCRLKRRSYGGVYTKVRSKTEINDKVYHNIYSTSVCTHLINASVHICIVSQVMLHCFLFLSSGTVTLINLYSLVAT